MKKSTKAGLVVVGATLVATGVFAALNSKDLQEKKAEDLVFKVWEEIKDDVVRTLNLKKTPYIKFEKEGGNDNAVMYVNSTIYTKGMFFDKVIIDVSTDYIIHVNAKAVAHTLSFYNTGAFYLAFDLPKMVVTQLLYHECRHIWQAEGDFYIGKHHGAVNFNLFGGHGEKPEELDANEFACSMAKTKREKVLANLQKKQQELSGKCYDTDWSVEKKAFIKEFNPILRLFC